MSWRCLSASVEDESQPFPRNGQCGVVSSVTQGFIVGFGFMLDFLAPSYFADLYHYDFASQEWTKLYGGEKGPCARVEASVAEVDGKLYLLGGYNQLKGSLEYFQDLWCYDPATRSWAKLSEELVPGFLPRVGVELVGVGSDLFGFFGYAAIGDGNIYFDDIIRFDFEAGNWVSISVQGDAPAPRNGHSVAAVGRKVYLYGGYNETVPGKYLGDLWAFDLDTLTWEQVESLGVAPIPRHSTGMVASSDGASLFLCGGMANKVYLNDVWKLDLASKEWSQAVFQIPTPPESQPSETEGKDGDEVVGPSGVQDEAKRLRTSDAVLSPRAFHTVALWNGTLVVFGGYGSSEEGQEGLYFGDLWSFPLGEGVEWKFEEIPEAS